MIAIPSSTVEFARSVSVADIIDAHGVHLRGQGFYEKVGPCPVCGGDDRFAINTRKGVFNCRGCGVGGDAISLEQFLTGHNFHAAVAALAGGTNGPSAEYQTRPAKSDADIKSKSYARKQCAKARHLHSLSRPAIYSVVASYLRTRGITTITPSIRALTKLSGAVSMLVAYGQWGEPVTAIHQTFLKADGSGKADITPNKISIGAPMGRALILAPFNETRRLAITEGVEDALVVFQATGIAAWAAGSAAYMPSLADKVPKGIEVLVCADKDLPGQHGADSLIKNSLPEAFEFSKRGLRNG